MTKQFRRNDNPVKRTLRITSILALIVFLGCLALLASVQATPGSAWAEDEHGQMSDVFQLGQKIIIRATYSEYPYTVKLYDPDGTEVKSWTSNTASFSSGVIDYGTNKLGKWTIQTSEWTQQGYVTGQYDVIFDVPFGALGAVAACFAGLSVKAFRAKK
jgi:hypothetical protein